MSETTLLPEQLAAKPGGQATQGRLGKLWKRVRRNYMAYLFLTPAFLLMLIFLVYPLLESLILSFYQWNGITPRTWVGLDNFRRLLSEDEVFTLSLRNNLLFSILT